MSPRRPPTANGGRRPEDDDPLELAPDEAIEGEVYVEEHELEPEAEVLAAVETAPSTVAPEPGPRVRRNGNGRGAVVERPESLVEE
ncbi:MAG TPA: hypothetical protein VFN74_08145, partial [Chloroflexota bacterium]|nr:hypothetical protein [Chloroflexota bacterium]